MNKIRTDKHYYTSFLAFQKWIIAKDAKDNSVCESTDKQIWWSLGPDIWNHLAFWNMGNVMVTSLIFFFPSKKDNDFPVGAHNVANVWRKWQNEKRMHYSASLSHC